MSPESWAILLEVNDGYYEFLENYRYCLGIVGAKVELDLMPIYSNLAMEPSVQNGTSSAQEWGSTGFNALVSMRPAHIGRKLQEGINIVYTDVDTIWRSSPLPYLAAAGSEADIVASVNAVENGESSPFYATGRMAVASNNRTIELFQQWHELHRATSTVNTPTFNRVLFSSSTVKHQPLSCKEFPNGKMYFEQFIGSQRAHVVVVHNDYIAGGSSRSGRGLKKHSLWNVTLAAFHTT
jgi:Nucleotide-diphospho-sugar transferase